MNHKDIPRVAVTGFIFLLLGYVVVFHYSPALEQVVIALALLAAGFWIGSSKGSSDKSDQLAEQASSTQPVEVVNDEHSRVPVDSQP